MKGGLGLRWAGSREDGGHFCLQVEDGVSCRAWGSRWVTGNEEEAACRVWYSREGQVPRHGGGGRKMKGCRVLGVADL